MKNEKFNVLLEKSKHAYDPLFFRERGPWPIPSACVWRSRGLRFPFVLKLCLNLVVLKVVLWGVSKLLMKNSNKIARSWKFEEQMKNSKNTKKTITFDCWIIRWIFSSWESISVKVLIWDRVTCVLINRNLAHLKCVCVRVETVLRFEKFETRKIEILKNKNNTDSL